MSFELGGYSFANTPRTPTHGYGPTAQAIRDVLEAVHVAEEAGLDFFGFGEHHTRSMPLSSPTALVNAAAASTHRIGLGTTITVLSTDEPIRVFQQLATAAAIAPQPDRSRRRSRIIGHHLPALRSRRQRLRHAVPLKARSAPQAQRPRPRHPERPAPAPTPQRHARRTSPRAATTYLVRHRRQPRIGSPSGRTRAADVPGHPRRHPLALGAIRPRLPQRLGPSRPPRRSGPHRRRRSLLPSGSLTVPCALLACPRDMSRTRQF